MKNKGFTLIELLGVLIVLSLIVVIVYPAVEKTLNGTRNSLYDDQITSMIDGAKAWIADHPYDIPKNHNEELTISLCDLKMGTYVEYDIQNPKTNKLFDCATKVIVKNVNNRYEYRVDLDGTTEENVTSNLSYPSVSIGNHLEYIKVGDIYNFSSITLNNEVINSDTVDYTLNITSNMAGGLSGTASTTGNYLIKYELINKSTNVKTVLYKTVIVTDGTI